MKKVLMVTYSFPPKGDAGVQRSLKFVKYLRDFGWEPLVLTREIKNMGTRDESLLKDVPEGVKVFRTNPWAFNELKGILNYPGRFINRKLLMPDGERLWAVFSKKTAISIIENEKPDMLYTTSVPYSSHLLGLYLKKRFPGLPWVADFRDEWTNNPYLLDNPYNSLRMNWEKRREHEVLQQADQLVTNTPVMLRNFLENNKAMALGDRFCVISNGYDSEDFAAIPGKPVDNKLFTMTYTGTLYGRRKPDYFFQALRESIDEDAVDPAKVTVQLIGALQKGLLDQQLEKYGLKDIVKILPYMDHDECLRHTSGSDALLLIEGGGPGAEAFYTGKVFEYLATGRPILANIPAKGAAASLIRDTGAGLVSDFNDVGETKKNLKLLYDAWLGGRDILSPRKDVIAKYERRALTGELAKAFENAARRVEKPARL